MVTTKIFLNDGGRNFLLPVTPESIQINDKNRIIRTNLLSLGEISQLGAKPLLNITFSSFFPEFIDSYVHINHDVLDTPQVWINRIKNLKRKSIFCLITHPRIMMKCFIQSFDYSSIGGQGEDINYTLSIIEARSPSIRSVNFGNLDQPIPQVTLIPFVKGDKTYQVLRGDTLASIARKTDVRMNALKGFNGIIDSSVELEVGKILILPKFRKEVDTDDLPEPF